MNSASSEALVLDLEIDATAAATGADQFDQAVDRVSQGAADAVSEVDRLERSTGAVGVTMTRTAGATRKIETDLDRLRRQIDPTWASQDKMRRATDLLDRSMRAGLITVDEHGQRLRQLEQRFGASATATNKAAAANDNMVQSTSRFGSVADIARRQLLGMGAALAAAFGGRAVLNAADEYVRFGNALRVAGTAAADMAEVEDRLFAAANRNGAEIEAVATLYSRASIAAAELGTNQDDLLRFIDGTTAALRVQGGSAASASGALLQLSQALGSGVVRAEEFNSILEGAFPIAQAAARGIDGMGGSVAKLRQAIVDGDITSKVFFEGLLKGFTATEAQAAGMSLTVGNSLTVLNNSFTRFVGRLDESIGVSAGLSSAIVLLGTGMDVLAENLDVLTVVATTAGGALVAMFGPAVLASVAAFTTATGVGAVGAVRALTAAVAANPLGLLITAIGTAIGLLIVYRSETFKVGDATVQVGKLATAQFRSMIEVVKGAALVMSEFAFAVWKGLTGDFSGAGASFSKIADEAANASARIREIWTNLGPDQVDVAAEIDRAMTAAGTATDKLSKGAAKALKETRSEIESIRDALKAWDLSRMDDMTKAAAPWAERAAELKDIIAANVLPAREMAAAHTLLAHVMTAGQQAIDDARKAVDKLGDDLAAQPGLLREEIAALGQSQAAYDSLIATRATEAAALAYQEKLIEAVKRGYDLEGKSVQELVDQYRRLHGEQSQAVKVRAELDKAAEDARKLAEATTDRVVDYAGDTFADFFADTPKSWREMWEDMRSTALQTLAKLGADLILRPVISPVVNAVYGAQGAGGTAGSLSGMVGGGGSSGGIGSIADVGKLISSFTKGSVTVGKGFAHAAEFLGGGAETQALAGNAGMNLSSPAGIAGGFAGNFLADAIFGSNRGMGSSIGGTLGAVAGSFIPIPFVGTALGAFVGNFIGGLFGGKVKQPQAILTTTALTAPESSFAAGVYQDTPFGRVGLGDAGTRKFPGEVAFVDFIATLDKGVARYLTDAQTEAAGTLLQTGAGAVRHKFDTFNLGEEGFLHASERIRAVSQSVFGDGVYEKLARGLGPIDEDDTGKNIEELIARFQQASGFLNNFDTILGELTSGVADFGAAARQQGVDQLRALTEALGGFDQMVETLGLSSSEVDAAKRSWVEVQLGLKEAAEPASALEQSIEQVKGFFSAAGELAKQVGISEQQVQQGLNNSLQKLAEGWDEGIADQILELTNPLELALRQQKEREESLLRDIETLGGSAEDRQRRILEVEKLMGIERQKIIEQYTGAAIDTIRGFLSDQFQGGGSVLAPRTVLANAEAEFGRLLGLANGGDSAALVDITGAAQNYLNAQRAISASGPEFFRVFDQVTDSLKAFVGDTTGMQSQTATMARVASNTEQLGPLLRDLGQVTARGQAALLAEMQAIRRRLEASEAETSRLNTQVARLTAAQSGKRAA